VRLKMKKLFFGLISLLILVGAVRQLAWGGQMTWPPEYRAKVSTRVYKANYGKVFSAVVDCSEDNGYPIIAADKENGIILTDYQSAGAILTGRGRIKLDFHITKIDENSTKVRLNIHCEYYSSSYYYRDRESCDNFIDEYDYQKIFDVIGQRIDTDKSKS
jgi:hypothetical protein